MEHTNSLFMKTKRLCGYAPKKSGGVFFNMNIFCLHPLSQPLPSQKAADRRIAWFQRWVQRPLPGCLGRHSPWQHRSHRTRRRTPKGSSRDSTVHIPLNHMFHLLDLSLVSSYVPREGRKYMRLNLIFHLSVEEPQLQRKKYLSVPNPPQKGYKGYRIPECMGSIFRSWRKPILQVRQFLHGSDWWRDAPPKCLNPRKWDV